MNLLWERIKLCIKLLKADKFIAVTVHTEENRLNIEYCMSEQDVVRYAGAVKGIFEGGESVMGEVDKILNK